MKLISKNKLIFIIILAIINVLGTSLNTFSQNLPDPAFATAIRLSCPTCIDASNNLLPPSQNIRTLDVRYKGISDLTGIEGFTKLQTLYCGGNLMIGLPSLPNTLTYLDCEDNLITSLPTLPNTIFNLYCSYNLLTSLPNLPNTLTYLICKNNYLVSLPTLPASVSTLNCQNNQLTHLPTIPSKLKFLDCHNNLITYLPSLPINLESLDCRNNQITCLPLLHSNLSINFSGNNVTCLPNKINGSSLPLCGVPDANFAEAIRNACPNCMDSCYKLLPAAANLASLNISNKNITDLTGISAFSNLQTLNCSQNQIMCLPNLPNTLTMLVIDNDKIQCLSKNIPNLKVYNAAGDSIATLPICLYLIPDINFANAIRAVCSVCIDECNQLLAPATDVTQLIIPDRNITDLTGIEWFSSLQYLDFHNNQATNLPSLSNTLIALNCDANRLQSLPSLPIRLSVLRCDANQLTSLPTLPSRLGYLYCSANLLTNLPTLPNTLLELGCPSNQLKNLPALPNSLTRLYCNSNQLTDLPTLSSNLEWLYCQNNQLNCLPTLPNSLKLLSIDTNKITCLPNIITGLNVYDNNANVIPYPPICITILSHDTNKLTTGTYVATKEINSAATLSVGTTSYYAGQSITLFPGFQTKNESKFLVRIRGCQ